MRSRKPRIGLLLGDPSGIGPELTAKLLAMPEVLERADLMLIGDPALLRQGERIAGTPPADLECMETASGAPFVMGKPTAGSGEYVLSTLRMGMECLGHRMIDAMVYAPLNKQAMKMAGMKAEDELHYFAGILGHTGTISEINVCGELWTSRVTSHVPLRFVADLITGERIEAVARLLHRAIAAAGTEQPRIAVAGVNPHAGEGGHLGTEEIDLIAPSVERLRADGMQVTGPLPADTLFIAARRGDFDGVVTMYHDQGQIALKLMGFERGVTVAGGLPVVIATPAHGTAFDIAGKGIADPGAMKSAFLLACRMAES